MLYPDLSNTNLVLRVYTVAEKKNNQKKPLSLTSKRSAVKQGNFRVRIFFFLPIQLAYKKSLNYLNFEFSSKFFTPIGMIHFIFLIENFKKRTIFP